MERYCFFCRLRLIVSHELKNGEIGFMFIHKHSDMCEYSEKREFVKLGDAEPSWATE